MAESIEVRGKWILVRTLEDFGPAEMERLDDLIERAATGDKPPAAADINGYESLMQAACLVTFDSVTTSMLNDMEADDVVRIVQTSLTEGSS